MPAEGISGRTVSVLLFFCGRQASSVPIPCADGFFICQLNWKETVMPVIMLIIHTFARLLRLEKAQARRNA